MACLRNDSMSSIFTFISPRLMKFLPTERIIIVAMQLESRIKKVPYSGKLSREKIFTNFAIFHHPQKFSPRNSRHATPIMRPVITFCESFLRKMLLSYRSAKVFSLKNFPLYGNRRSWMATNIHLVLTYPNFWCQGSLEIEHLRRRPFQLSRCSQMLCYTIGQRSRMQ